MTGINQRAELQAKIWKIANEVRGSIDGWDFKQYVLGTLFYRFISENFANYMEAGDDSIDYAALPDDAIPPELREDAIKTKGYFIRPSCERMPSKPKGILSVRVIFLSMLQKRLIPMRA